MPTRSEKTERRYRERAAQIAEAENKAAGRRLSPLELAKAVRARAVRPSSFRQMRASLVFSMEQSAALQGPERAAELTRAPAARAPARGGTARNARRRGLHPRHQLHRVLADAALHPPRHQARVAVLGAADQIGDRADVDAALHQQEHPHAVVVGIGVDGALARPSRTCSQSSLSSRTSTFRSPVSWDTKSRYPSGYPRQARRPADQRVGGRPPHLGRRASPRLRKLPTPPPGSTRRFPRRCARRPHPRGTGTRQEHRQGGGEGELAPGVALLVGAGGAEPGVDSSTSVAAHGTSATSSCRACSPRSWTAARARQPFGRWTHSPSSRASTS